MRQDERRLYRNLDSIATSLESIAWDLRQLRELADDVVIAHQPEPSTDDRADPDGPPA